MGRAWRPRASPTTQTAAQTRRPNWDNRQELGSPTLSQLPAHELRLPGRHPVGLYATGADHLTARRAAEVIAKHVNPDGEAWPPIGVICTLVRAARRSVDRTINELVDLGILQISKTGNTSARAVIYRLVGYGQKPAWPQPPIRPAQPVAVDSNDATVDSNDTVLASNSTPKPPELWTQTTLLWTQTTPLWTQTTAPYLIVAKDSSKTPIRENLSSLRDAPAAPPHTETDPAKAKRPVGNRRRAAKPSTDTTPAKASSPRPDDLVKIYNEQIAGSPIIPIERPLNRGECVMLAQAMKTQPQVESPHPDLVYRLSAVS
jgi:hypothetical protein